MDGVPFFVRSRVRKRAEKEQISEIIDRRLDYYTNHCAGGERLGEIMEKKGEEDIIETAVP